MKFRRLQHRLGLPKYAVIGILESLWIATQVNCPRGDIGQFDDEAICIEIGYVGDPVSLISSLVETGWLDRDDKHRLVVHDWPEHAPRYVHGVVSKIGGFIVPHYSGPLQSATTVGHYSGGRNSEDGHSSIGGCEQATTVLHYSQPLQSPTVVPDSRARALPNLTEPNLTKPSASARTAETISNLNGFDLPVALDDPEFRSAWREWAAYRSEIRHPLKASTVKRQLAMLAKFSTAVAIAAIRQSITQGWQGLFPEKVESKSAATGPGQVYTEGSTLGPV